jgi:flagellin FlaB
MEKWIKTLRWFARNKKAISGLETAIVLIAFVIVASAFAYAVLNMGFLATQKSQQVVLGGLQAASSALVVDGPVYGYSTCPGSNGNITSVIFWLKTASAATSVDLNVNKTTIGFENPRGVWPNIYSNVALGYAVGGGSIEYNVTASATNITWEVGTGYQLVAGQKVRVTIDLTQLYMHKGGPTGFNGDTYTTGGKSASEGMVMKNEEFKIIIKPPTGSVLEIDRVAPAAINTVNDLS